MKTLLIVYASQTGNTRALAEAVQRGAAREDIAGVACRLLHARSAGVLDLLGADALVLATPENFGYMSGAMKDFLDRTYYPCEGRIESLPFAIVVSAGNDGSGAVRSIQRIARGYPVREVQEAIVVVGPPGAAHLEACSELGATLAAGLELGIY